MGCAGSKQKRCERCKAQYTPVRRSYSVQLEHQLEQAKSESFHLVALTSSTLGSLKLDLSTSLSDASHLDFDFVKNKGGVDLKNCNGKSGKEQFLEGIVEAKTWSNMIEQKIPKTPTRTPEGEPERIDVRELMKGLEDISPFWSPNHFRSVSSDAVMSPIHENFKLDGSDFDPTEISSFRKSLETLSPYRLSPLNGHKSPKPIRKERVVLYFTSLRGVRKTYEDCCSVRLILKGAGVRVDERDASMHSGFKEELKVLLGERFPCSGTALLPRVFLGEKYIGGVEEIRRLHEEGRLEKELEGCEMVGDQDSNGDCEACGDVRFVPCETCSGSCKIYHDELIKGGGVGDECENSKGGHGESDQFGFQRCPDCNENGLVRCPLCCF
ncbi:uncharacterized protein At3g28850-like [Punica granatum]|uniref:Uncharacterized protein n=2 Tax=Punica granatum TaxID=22663 RepID=A0A2I0HNF3_PUNGR|nr:uncharacterized protein At3g28850-like [Punica granatum]PKI33267.1 hypothetical protein CRG98_046341 [Punica granatum]